MRRTALVSGVVAFAMAFLGNVAASMLAGPMLVEAQEARLRAERVTVVGDNGADRMLLRVSPTGRAFIDLLDADGVRRVSAAQGGAPGSDDAGFFVFDGAGTQTVGTVFLGTNRGGPAGEFRSSLVLFDSQRRIRAALRVNDDGPSLTFFDADGNATWEAK
jgi:hypothetical protein